MPKYEIRKSRFINNEYIHATPEFPAEVEIPVGTKLDVGLHPVDAEAKAEYAKWLKKAPSAPPAEAKPHYVPTDTKVPTAIEAQGPVKGKAKGGREADSDAV